MASNAAICGANRVPPERQELNVVMLLRSGPIHFMLGSDYTTFLFDNMVTGSNANLCQDIAPNLLV